MKKITARDLSPEAFEAWKETPWFQTFLSNYIEMLGEAAMNRAQAVLEVPLEQIDVMRLETSEMRGRAMAFVELQDLVYTDVVEEEDEEA